jgi:hypothetical protein
MIWAGLSVTNTLCSLKQPPSTSIQHHALDAPRAGSVDVEESSQETGWIVLLVIDVADSE